MKNILVRMSALALLTILSACGGGSSSPTSPTSTSATPTKIITISGSLSFGDVLVGQSRDATVTIGNSGNTAMALTGVTATGGLTTQSTASPTTGTIPAGGSLPILFRFTPTAVGNYAGTVTFTTDHTSGTNTLAMSGAGVALPVTVTGVVSDSSTRRALGGVRVTAGTANSTTDGNGFYSMVVAGATPVSVSYTLAGYNTSTATVTFSGDTRRDVSLVPFWTASGRGNTVFDMPAYVSRVRVQGVWDQRDTSNFIVRVGGRSIINEILRSTITYDGTHLVSGGGVVEITSSNNITWTFTQVQ